MLFPERKIVVTGIGVIAPNGQTLDDFWLSLCAGKSSASFITRFDTAEMPCKVGCEIKDFDATQFIDAKKARRYDRSILYAVAAAKLAVRDASLDIGTLDLDRTGIYEGTSVSGIDNSAKSYAEFAHRGYRAIKPYNLVNAFCGGASSEIALELGIHGQATTICTACSAGNDAIGYALQAIRDDLGDVMIAGASEAPLVDGYWSIFSAAGVMTREMDNPAVAMKPFDRRRDGFVLGEGATFFILEELSHALSRGARIYAEVVGHGQSCDAHHPVAQHPDGRGTYHAMEKALRQAQMAPSEIDYINAHGSATASNDVIETNAIKRFFGPHARRVAISATKPVTGHLAGATAAIEAAICVLSIQRHEMPPTVNLTEPEDGCDLDYIIGQSRRYPVRAAMNINAGFGGKNSCLVFRRYPDS